MSALAVVADQSRVDGWWGFLLAALMLGVWLLADHTRTARDDTRSRRQRQGRWGA